jgi:hypothetical protein
MSHPQFTVYKVERGRHVALAAFHRGELAAVYAETIAEALSRTHRAKYQRLCYAGVAYTFSITDVYVHDSHRNATVTAHAIWSPPGRPHA